MDGTSEVHVTADQAGGRVMMVMDVVVLLMFVFSVVVQFNDPDPLLWSALYGAAAAACALWLARRLTWWFSALIGAAAGIWAATLAPRVIGKVRFLDMFGAFEMRNIGIEESREMYGLLLVAAWMAVLTVRAYRRTA